MRKVASLRSIARKTREDGFIDPRTPDFAQSQAVGRGVGAGIAGAALGAVGSAAVGASAKNSLLAITGAGALTGGATYMHKLRKFKQLQAQGKNPATNKPFNVERIERLRKWGRGMTKKNRKTASAPESHYRAGYSSGFIKSANLSR